MKNNDWKDRLNVVYSTNPDFNYDMDDDQEQVTLDKTNKIFGFLSTGKIVEVKSLHSSPDS